VAQAQQKELTDDQYFKSNFKAITQSLPTVTRWIDNSHFLLLRNGKAMWVDAATGTEREATDAEKKSPEPKFKPVAYAKGKDLFIKGDGGEIQLTHDEELEVNPTMSPDSNYVAYTKKNDLYSIDLRTKKETRLTSDGSDVILNGYASWVYMEEILGRASQYRAFWWSPDSKQIAFFRSDDSEVPVFTITDANTQHGYVEKVRYPKVGDKNPEVKVGIVSPEGGNPVWCDFNPKDDQYFGLPYWKPDASALLVQWMNRKQNQLRIWSVNPANGSKTIFYSEDQPTWISLDDEGERLHFLNNKTGLILQSDASG
jgi:dipeptidyl-peptidase-4